METDQIMSAILIAVLALILPSFYPLIISWNNFK